MKHANITITRQGYMQEIYIISVNGDLPLPAFYDFMEVKAAAFDIATTYETVTMKYAEAN